MHVLRRDSKTPRLPSFPCARVAARATQRPICDAPARKFRVRYFSPVEKETAYRTGRSRQEQEAIEALAAALKKNAPHPNERTPAHLELASSLGSCGSSTLAAVGPDAITQRFETLLALLPDDRVTMYKLLDRCPDTLLSAPSEEMLRRMQHLAYTLGVSLPELLADVCTPFEYVPLLSCPYQLEALRMNALWLEDRIREHLPESREPHALVQALVRFTTVREELGDDEARAIMELRLQELATYKHVSPVATDLAEQGYPAAEEEDYFIQVAAWLSRDATSKAASYLRYLLVYGKDVPEPHLDPFDYKSNFEAAWSSDVNFRRFHDDWQRRTQDLVWAAADTVGGVSASDQQGMHLDGS